MKLSKQNWKRWALAALAAAVMYITGDYVGGTKTLIDAALAPDSTAVINTAGVAK